MLGWSLSLGSQGCISLWTASLMVRDEAGDTSEGWYTERVVVLGGEEITETSWVRGGPPSR